MRFLPSFARFSAPSIRPPAREAPGNVAWTGKFVCVQMDWAGQATGPETEHKRRKALQCGQFTDYLSAQLQNLFSFHVHSISARFFDLVSFDFHSDFSFGLSPGFSVHSDFRSTFRSDFILTFVQIFNWGFARAFVRVFSFRWFLLFGFGIRVRMIRIHVSIHEPNSRPGFTIRVRMIQIRAWIPQAG